MKFTRREFLPSENVSHELLKIKYLYKLFIEYDLKFVFTECIFTKRHTKENSKKFFLSITDFYSDLKKYFVMNNVRKANLISNL